MAKQDRGKLDTTLSAMFSNIEYRTNYLFYAHLVGQCSIKIDETLEAPAAVNFARDHYNLYINPSRFDKYSLTERLAILRHECHHILGNHFDRLGDRKHFLAWNIATDCAINQQDHDNHLPKDCITPKSLSEMLDCDVPILKEAEFYYELIMNELDNQDDSDNKKSLEDAANSIDDHKIWEDSEGDPDLKSDITKKMIEKAQEETIKGKGKIPAECAEWIELHSRKNEVNWKQVLRRIVGNKRTSKRPTIMRRDRRMPNRIDLKGKTKDHTFDLLVVADVSGSMDDEAITRTLQEVRHICDITKTGVNLIQVDSQAYPPEVLTKKTKTFARKAFGGTNLNPALEMANLHGVSYDAVVVLSDGYLCNNDIDHFKNLGKKVIWLIEPKGNIMDEMNYGKMQAIKLTF